MRTKNFLFPMICLLFTTGIHAQTSTATIAQSGWYRIAQNGTTLGATTGGSRAAARFILTDKTSAMHQTVEFLAYINYNLRPSVAVLNNSYYGTGAIPFLKIRILCPSGTYAGSAVEVYVNSHGANAEADYIQDNDQTNGWTAQNWQQVATTSGDNDGVPSGFTAYVITLQDLVTGYVTSNGQQSSFYNGNFYTSGNLLLGKTTQINTAYKLDVNGKVRANEVVVNTTGADFVFDSSYKLPPLAQTEQYITSNHHLPGFESASVMQQNGLEVGVSQAKLLQKIEELTLYLIAQDKQSRRQEAKLSEQQEQLQHLEKENSSLKAAMQQITGLEARLKKLETTIKAGSEK